MIKFEGVLSGEAEKRFLEKTAAYERNLIFFGLAFAYPLVIFMAVQFEAMTLAVMYLFLFLLVFLLTKIPKSQKEKMSILPKTIVINQEYLTCFTQKGKDKKGKIKRENKEIPSQKITT